MNRRINTVTGEIAVEDLGRTLTHEHILVGLPGAEFDPDNAWDRSEVVEQAVRRLKELRDWGVRTFVDPCPIELGRDVSLMAEISERAEMQIICTTGFYTEPLGIPAYWRHRDQEEITELFVREIEQGVGRTGIRAGAIKCATSSPDIPAAESLCLSAAATAQHATGVPIITHTEGGLGGPEQHAALVASGARADRCLIGHCCGNPDPAYHRQVLAGGAFIGFDRIGMAIMQSDEIRADNIVRLVQAGLGHRVIMSQDRLCKYVGKLRAAMLPPEPKPAESQDYSHSYIFSDFLPKLRDRGLDDAQIFPILDVNPQQLFSENPN